MRHKRYDDRHGYDLLPFPLLIYSPLPFLLFQLFSFHLYSCFVPLYATCSFISAFLSFRFLILMARLGWNSAFPDGWLVSYFNYFYCFVILFLVCFIFLVVLPGRKQLETSNIGSSLLLTSSMIDGGYNGCRADWYIGREATHSSGEQQQQQGKILSDKLEIASLCNGTNQLIDSKIS